MSTEDDKTKIVAPEGAEGEAKPKKGMGKLVLFGGIGLGVVVVGVVLAIFVLKPMMSGGEEKSADGATDSTAAAHGDPKKAEHAEKKVEKKHAAPKKKEDSHGKSKSGASEEEGSLVYVVKDLVINPAGTNGSRFLSVSFGLEMETTEAQAELVARDPLVRDALITIMSSKTVAQLTDAREKEITRLQIKKRLSDLLESSDIAAVYFTDFVLQ